MKYTQSDQFRPELQAISDVLELINYRSRTVDSYLQSIFECCTWLETTYQVSLEDASILQLRSFLLYLKRSREQGGKGYAPRSVNIYNCALKKYFRFVLRKPLTNDDLPVCKVDHPLPKVPSKKDTFTLISGIRNKKHRALLAMAYGCALRLLETVTLRFGDISFTDDFVMISGEVSKSRYAGKIELPKRLKAILYDYWKEECQGSRSQDWLFPGQKPGSHLSTGTAAKVLKNRIRELGWEDRGYSFHSLRHAHALHYYQAGADLFQVRQRLRHRSIASTLVYVQLDAVLRERKAIENPFDDPRYPL